ncbi:hypothetical protein PHYBLDRAFT_176249 [Phycomyces blakesleeanus NRRL 1555(-)]|uniref:ATP-dependent DNA helicase n=1 Tax=Phycomyces blakesleeanus (strain ATCC 8743b / DSM 1359 / FGSC 10004 / NBRC 33097 / NRRL 1555) TaxID=763407 RepID=A0A167J710_PHYB8|nr:hypothetical protein PHYBLDRAFT_176249 [Phycomyces blakesleeanus NRRL 1555(-)]OAD65337.1 hypothetical protein PHYBLDRAFT_176249 [Phycomyces blakesleeanus NRRL 1555(-)]|eukprot:XP_018283377.1 hypothetical protein PHYBLDRAFT_176249 [Phycomyces blakesleeanus NRRL 1555(-)]
MVMNMMNLPLMSTLQIKNFHFIQVPLICNHSLTPSESICASCRLSGHKRRSNMLCPLNNKNTRLYVPEKRTYKGISTNEEISAESSQSAALRLRHEVSSEETTQVQVQHVLESNGSNESDENDEDIESDDTESEDETDDSQSHGIARKNPLFSMCCNKGSVLLLDFEPTPSEMASLLVHGTAASNIFFQKIRAYNSTLSFTLLGAKINHSVANNRSGAYCFRIHGTICHNIGSVLPSTAEDLIKPRYAQLYIYDPVSQVNFQHNNASHLNQNIIEQIQSMLIRVNPFVSLFKSMEQYCRTENQVVNLTLRLVADSQQDQRRYNAPTAEEVAVLIMNNEPGTSRDIVLHTQSNGLQHINEYHRSYDSLHYVLMFPFGKDGWTITSCGTSGKKVTAMQWYSSRLMYCKNSLHLLHLFGRLFQQYIVDMYAKIEHNRIIFIAKNQKRLRVDLYSGVQDAMNLNDGNLNNLGRRFLKAFFLYYIWLLECIYCLTSVGVTIMTSNGPGGTGKTFVFNALLCHVCHQGKIALAVATSGIAALLLVDFQCCQFPVRLAFAMTINKSQGQTLDHVGLYLPSPVFGHGQLYVALSRIRKPSGIKIMVDIPDASTTQNTVYTDNVIYHEVFDEPTD